MRARPLVNFYQTLLSISRLQLKDCPLAADQAVVKREIKRFEQRLARCNRRAAVSRKRSTD